MDLSKSSTGFSIVKFENGEIEILDKGYIKDEKFHTFPFLLRVIRLKMLELYRKWNYEVVVFEDLNISFLATGKKLLPIHGVVLEATQYILGCSPYRYAPQTWRSVLGIRDFTKKEKEVIRSLSKNTAEYKRLSSFKVKAIEYVKDRLGVEFSFEENDICDSVCLALAHIDVVGSLE